MLRVEIYRIDNVDNPGIKVGFFFIPNNLDLEWFKRNTPNILYGAQLISEEIKAKKEQ